MHDPALQAVEKILSAIYHTGDGRGLSQEFIFGKPGAPHWDRGLGVSLHHDHDEMLDAVLKVRSVGADYLQYLPLEDVWELVRKFIADNFWFLASDVFGKNFSHSFLDEVSETSNEAFARALENSTLFKPKTTLYIFPIPVIAVHHPFGCPDFFLASSSSLLDMLLPREQAEAALLPDHFPPFRDFDVKKVPCTNWLGIRAHSDEIARRVMVAVLGAIALTPVNRVRFTCSERTIPGRYCTIGDGVSARYGDPPTPNIAQDFQIDQSDHLWLSHLSSLFNSSEKGDFRKIMGLEYFYRAWFVSGAQQYAWLFMSIESICGDARQAGQSVSTP